jgi:hypothetical protein
MSRTGPTMPSDYVTQREFNRLLDAYKEDMADLKVLIMKLEAKVDRLQEVQTQQKIEATQLSTKAKTMVAILITSGAIGGSGITQLIAALF